MDVVLLHWPAEAGRRDRLTGERVPRLLLVAQGEPPPDGDDCMEDWIRVPASEADMRARVAGVGARARAHADPLPYLDRDGVLRFNGTWVALPPLEARLTKALVERFGAVVSREALGRAGWPLGPPGRNALDVHMLRLRRRLAGHNLVIHTVRSRGYMLEAKQRGRHGVRQA